MSVRVFLEVDGAPLEAVSGESVAAALLRVSSRALHRSRTGEPRGLFCGIGMCYECHATIDGRPHVRTCVTPVRDGMRVETQT
jgi:sarcosine oxidase subunit alpha